MSQVVLQQIMGGMERITDKLVEMDGTMQAGYHRLGSDMEVIHQRLEQVDSKLVAFNEQLEKVETDLVTLNHRLDKMETELIAIHPRLDKMETAIDRLHQRLDTELPEIHRKLATITEQVGATTESLVTSMDERKRLEHKVNEHETDIRLLKKLVTQQQAM